MRPSLPAPGTGALQVEAISPPARAGRWLARLKSAPARSRRVGLLLGAVLIISMADLDMTLAYAASGGMIESNPLARAVMTYGSSGMLALWKVLSVVLCVWILFRARARRSAEIATWVCFLALVWLTFRWQRYNEQMPAIAHVVMSEPDPETRLLLLDQ